MNMVAAAVAVAPTTTGSWLDVKTVVHVGGGRPCTQRPVDGTHFRTPRFSTGGCIAWENRGAKSGCWCWIRGQGFDWSQTLSTSPPPLFDFSRRQSGLPSSFGDVLVCPIGPEQLRRQPSARSLSRA